MLSKAWAGWRQQKGQGLSPGLAQQGLSLPGGSGLFVGQWDGRGSKDKWHQPASPASLLREGRGRSKVQPLTGKFLQWGLQRPCPSPGHKGLGASGPASPAQPLAISPAGCAPCACCSCALAGCTRPSRCPPQHFSAQHFCALPGLPAPSAAGSWHTEPWHGPASRWDTWATKILPWEGLFCFLTSRLNLPGWTLERFPSLPTAKESSVSCYLQTERC